MALVAPTPAQAVGTPAGTTISNTATATWTDPSGASRTVPSNKVDIKVDEVIDVKVASADPGDVPTTPGAVNQVLTFTVTNTGNGQGAFKLNFVNAIGGDQFDPTTTSLVLDTNGNGKYDPGVDTVYQPGVNDPVLAPDASIKVFVLSTIPGNTQDGNRGETDLTAASAKGTGTPGTLLAGQGANGSDAVIGASGGQGRGSGFYVVNLTSATLAKSATVLDPYGGSKPMPGAVITYTLVTSVTGSGSLTGLAVSDPLPAQTSYQPGTLTLQGAPLTDAADGDAGEVGSANGVQTVTVRLGTVAGGGSRTVSFKVKIN